jgi:hypothetical protein
MRFASLKKFFSFKSVVAPLVLSVGVTGCAAIGMAGAAGTVDPTALPLGDYKYKTDGAKRGYVYTCHQLSGVGGAGVEGPWINTTNGTYDSTAKATVNGSVSWAGHVSIYKQGDRRIITGNGLPKRQTTGTYPIQSSDDAYKYDRNPNSIYSQSDYFSLPANPKKGSPQCIGGEVGVAINGVKIFDAFDAGGRDANAHEIQDKCGGHPEMTGTYHYHQIPSCLYENESTHKQSKVVGWAYDGFPITGPRGHGGQLMTNDDLDACHGKTSRIKVDGKWVRMYHYVATEEFPYTVGCFKGTEVASNVPR